MNTVEMAKIDEWLRGIGCTPTSVQEPGAFWHLQFNYPVNSPHLMHVIAPMRTPRAIVVLSRVSLESDLIEKFEGLDADAKDDFLWNLRETLNIVDIEFMLEGAPGPLDCPTSIQTMLTRYDDGLTLDSLAHSVGAVFKTELRAMWVVQRHLGSKGYGSGDRFDFRRLGI